MLSSCWPRAHLRSPPVMVRAKAFSPRIAPLPALALCVREHHTRLSLRMHVWLIYKSYGNISGPFSPPTRRVDVPCSHVFGEMLMGAASPRLDQICVFPVLISWEKTTFSPHLQLRFSKKSSLQRPRNRRAPEHSPPAPLEPFPALYPFGIIPYYLGWKFLRAGELV